MVSCPQPAALVETATTHPVEVRSGCTVQSNDTEPIVEPATGEMT